MLNYLKQMLGIHRESRLEKAVATLESAATLPPIQAIQSLTDWLSHEQRRATEHRDGLVVLRGVDAMLRKIAEEGLAGMLDSQANHTRMTLLSQNLVPFCSAILALYTAALRREMVEQSRKPSNTSLIQTVVGNWMYWIGRDHVVRFIREPKTDRLPWHEIRPAAEFALDLSGKLGTRITQKNEGEGGRLQKELAHLVLLSRTLTPDLQGRQLLIADRLAKVLAGFISVSNEHSSATPFGQADNTDSAPTVLTRVPTQIKREGKGLYCGLERTLMELVAMEQLIAGLGKVPQKINPDGKLEVGETLGVIKHLKNRWSGQDVKRMAERKPASGSLTISHDYVAVRRLIAAAQQQKTNVKTNEPTVERALVQDVSATGLGLKLVQHTGWLKMGMILGIKTDKDVNWRVGIVRRALTRAQGEMTAGVQLLGGNPESIRLTRRAQVSQWEKVTEHQSWDNILGLYLRPDSLNADQHVLVLAKPELEVGKTYAAPSTRDGDLTFRILSQHEIGADCVFYHAECTVVAPVHAAPSESGSIAIHSE
ncbi:hypothetical protein [Chitinimonas sp. BJB300]|uniref:hypothetical protein n=1 Tax=Chitinimonas sp. BJB300 TaxID=1559339 RepID=UPI0011119A1C|nr:hypothetical protein [Chitinimonas sp. BJB300]TSJ85254.1 hypothetical protein FG002_017730 [Chitinimonas sp. BJB300]